MKAVILDTQLMVLLVAGMTERSLIASHRRLNAFREDDFDLLLLLLGPDPDLLLLPNTVSEAANLLRQHREPQRNAIMQIFRRLILANRESYIASKKVVERLDYRRLGVTDCAILECCTDRSEILTADWELYWAASRIGLSVTNFNHKREEFGLA